MIEVAVFGAGRIGKIHAGNVAANPRAKLVAVADPFAEAANPLAGTVQFRAGIRLLICRKRPIGCP